MRETWPTWVLAVLAVVGGPDGVAAQSPQAVVEQVQCVNQGPNSCVGSLPDEGPTRAAREALRQALNAYATGDEQVLRSHVRKMPRSHARVIQPAVGISALRVRNPVPVRLWPVRRASHGCLWACLEQPGPAGLLLHGHLSGPAADLSLRGPRNVPHAARPVHVALPGGWKRTRDLRHPAPRGLSLHEPRRRTVPVIG